MASIKKNIVLNIINTLTGIVFPIITFPYAARVLLPDGIGAVNFQLSVVNYIVLLTSLGIPLYAVKEVAKHRDDKAARDKLTVELIALSVILCLFGYIAVWVLGNFVPQIREQKTLFYILSLSVIFTAIGVNWFYQGIEDFKFITIRAVVVRCLAAASLFIFVKTQKDLLIYGVIVVASTVGNNFINFVHLRKHIGISVIKIKELEVFKHLAPALHIFMFNLITSLYVHLNSVMLGFMDTDEAVGYYTAGTKISHVALTVITSLGTVLLPRCSNLLEIGDKKGFAKVIGKSLNLTLALSLPIMAGLMVLAYPMTMIFCGNEYGDAVPVLIWNAPVILFIGITNVMGIQVLYPKDKINLVLISVSGGAIANLLLNLWLIPIYSAVGASIAALAAEGMVLLLQMILGYKYFPFKLSALLHPAYLLATVIMALAVWGTITLLPNLWTQLCVGIAVGAAVYAATLCLLKDSLFMETVKTVLRR